MTDGTVVQCGADVEVIYQIPSEDLQIAEQAIIIRRYSDGGTFGFIQGDNELVVGVETLPLLVKSLRDWYKGKEQA